MTDRVRHAPRSTRGRPSRRDPGGRLGVRRAWATLLAAAVLPLVLSSCVLGEYLLGVRDGCTEYTRSVDFATSSAVLRGSWQGTVDDYPAEGVASTLTMDLTSSYVDVRTYTVSGTFVVGAEEALALTGTVHGGCGERYLAGDAAAAGLPQVEGDVLAPSSAPPPVSLSAEVRDASGALVWTARAYLRFPRDSGLETDAFDLWLEGAIDVRNGGPGNRDVAMSRSAAP